MRARNTQECARVGARGIKGSLIGTIVSINPQIFVEFNSEKRSSIFFQNSGFVLAEGKHGFPERLVAITISRLFAGLMSRMFVELLATDICGIQSQVYLGKSFPNVLWTSFPE